VATGMAGSATQALSGRGAPAKGRLAARIAWGICLVTLVLVAVTLVLDFLQLEHESLPGRLRRVLYLALAVPTAAVGALITSRRPGNRMGDLMLAAGLAVSGDQFAWDYVHYGRAHRLAGVQLIGWVENWIWVLSPALLLFALLLYPDGRLCSPRWRPVAWAVAVWAGVTVGLAALGGGIYDGPPVEDQLALHGRPGQALRTLVPLLFSLFPVLLVAAAGSLLLRFRGAGGEERQQVKWLSCAAALVAVVWALPDSRQLGAWKPVANNLVVWSVPVTIGVAVLRHHLYNIDVIIHRTLVYSTLTAILGVVYVGVVLVLGQLFGAVGRELPSWAVAGATLAVAGLFQPARRRVQDAVDRRFNRRRYDAAKTIEAFSARLRGHTDLDTLSVELLGVVRQAMQPTEVSLWLRPPPPAWPVTSSRRRASARRFPARRGRTATGRCEPGAPRG
jgi:hypothetical protein